MEPLLNPFLARQSGAATGDDVLTPGARSMVRGRESDRAAAARESDRAAKVDPVDEEMTVQTQRKTDIGRMKAALDGEREAFIQAHGAAVFETDPLEPGKFITDPATKKPRLKWGGGQGQLDGTQAMIRLRQQAAKDPAAAKQLEEMSRHFSDNRVKLALEKLQRIEARAAQLGEVEARVESRIGELAQARLARAGVLGAPAARAPLPMPGQPSPSPAAAPALRRAPPPLGQTATGMLAGDLGATPAGPAAAAQPVAAETERAGGQQASDQPRAEGEDGRPTIKPIEIIRMHRQIKDAEAVAGMETSNPQLRAASTEKVEALKQRVSEGMAALPEIMRKRVVDATRDPTFWEQVKNFGARTAEGAGSTLVDVAEFGARQAARAGNAIGLTEVDPANNAATRFTDAMREVASEWGPDVAKEVQAKLEASTAGTIGQAVGSTAAFIAPGMLIGRLGRVAKLGEPAIKKLVTAGVALTGAAASGNSLRREADLQLRQLRDAGKITTDDYQKGVAQAEAIGALVGTSEVLPISKFAGRLSKTPVGSAFVTALLTKVASSGTGAASQWLRGAGKEMLHRTATAMGEGFEEAVQEFGQSIADNLTASGKFGNVAWDPERDIITSDTVEGSEIGFLVGALFGAATAGRAPRAPAAPSNEIPPTPEVPPNPAGDVPPPPAGAEPVVETPGVATPVVESEEGVPVTQAFEFQDLSGKKVTVEASGVKAAVAQLPADFEPDMAKTRAVEKPAPTTAPVTPVIPPSQGPAAGGAGSAPNPGSGVETPAPASPPGADHVAAIEGDLINKDWTAFNQESQSLGIPRAEMPQVKAEHRGALTQFLKARGIASTEAAVLPSELKPTQAEFSPAKVEKARKFTGGDRAILVSSDNHVVDGHHQWMAKLTDSPAEPMRVIRLNAPIRKLVRLVGMFPSAKTAAGSTPAESGSQETKSPLQSLLGRFDSGEKQIATVADLASEVERMIEDGSAPETLAEALDDYREAAREDFEELGGRGDVDGYESAFENAVRAAAGSNPANLQPPAAASDTSRAPTSSTPEPGPAAANPGVVPQKVPTETPQGAVGGEQPAPVSSRAGAGKPAIARGENKPAKFVQTIAKSAGLKGGDRATKFLGDFAPRLHRMNPKAFVDMEVRVMDQAGWDATPETHARTPDSAGAYNPDTNTLYLNSDKAKGEGVIDVIVHESGHFAEKFALGEEFTQQEWEKLTPAQREAAIMEYAPRPGRPLSEQKFDKNDRRARSEWVAMQFARVVRGDTKQMPEGLRARLQKWLDEVRQLVRRWIGSENLTTKELDAMILEKLGYAKRSEQRTQIGVTKDGNPLFEDALGVRSYEENGFIFTEAVGLIPTRSGIQFETKSRVGSSWESRDEIAARAGVSKPETVAAPPPPAPEQKPAKSKVDDLADKLFDGLLGTPGLAQEAFPKERRQVGIELADAMIEAGIVTPDGMARWMDKKYEKKARKFSDALWSLFRFSNPNLPTVTDWAAVYGSIDAPAQVPQASPEPVTPKAISVQVRDWMLDAVAGKAGPLTRRDIATMAEGRNLTPKQVDEHVELGIVLAAQRLTREGAPLEVFDAMLRLYDSQPNLTAKTSTSKINQAYSTPAPIAFLASQLADVNGGGRVTEPTAGNGMLLIEATPSRSQANEIDPERRNALEAQGFAPTAMDAADDRYGKSLEPSDRIIMNPPFGAVKDEGQSKKYPLFIVEAPQLETTSIDQAIAMNTLRSMKADGKAVLIIGSGAGQAVEPAARKKAYMSGMKQSFFYYLYQQYRVTDHFTIDGDLYAKQGAGWPIDVIVIDGRGRSELPFPWVNVPPILTSWNELRGKISDRARGADAGLSRPRSGIGAGSPVPGPRGDGQRPGSRVSPGSASDGAGTLRPDPAGESGVRTGESAGSQPDAAREPARASGNQPDGAQPAEPGVGQGGSVPAGPEVLEAPVAAPVPIETNSTGMQAVYRPRSESPQATAALTPVNLVSPTARALQAVQARRGNLDEFVAKELGYKGTAELFKHLDGGQVDAVALALDNVLRGGALITGDQTGMGKGRTVAAMMRYAVRQGITPIFVTKNPGLYADMLRDLEDIGSGNILPFLTNNNEKVALEDQNGVVVKQIRSAAPKAQVDLINGAISSGSLPGGAKVIFTTYDQIKSDWPKGYKEDPKGVRSRKQKQMPKPDGQRTKFLRQFARKGFVILDEAHIAGGESDTGWRVTQIISGRDASWNDLGSDAKPTGIYYSSATYAKAPKNMGVYFETNVKRAVENPKALATMMEKGGVPLQQVLSSMLAQDGQYIRRELDFTGIEFLTRHTDERPDGSTDAARAARERRLADSYTEPLREVIDFNRDVLRLVEMINRQLAEQGIKTEDGKTLADELAGMNFGDQIHNMVRQYLLAIKSEGIAAEAIAALQAGKSPVIAVHNTMESVLDDLGAGGYPPDFDGMLYRYLDKATETTLTRPDKSKQKIKVNLENLRASFPMLEEIPAGAVALARQLIKTREIIVDLIKAESRADIPVSPIDLIRERIESAGFKFGEISGRQNYLRDGKVAKRAKEDSTKAGQNKILAKFNRDPKTALLLTVSGSTGISAHASEKFKNQQPRVMIVGQILPDINDMIQMFGRVFRKGQVRRPEYVILNTTIPAEKRLSAILSLRLASLNANTTSAGKGVNTGAAGGVDFLNKYGDEVVYGYLADHPELVNVMRNTFKSGSLPSLEDLKGGDWFGTGDFAKSVTGEIAILPYDDQAAFYSTVLEEYQAKINFLTEIGENDLIAQNLPLEAELQEKRLVFKSEGDSVFDGPAYLETVKTKSTRKPVPAEDIPAIAAANEERVSSLAAGFQKRADAVHAADMAALQAKHGTKENWDEVRSTAEMKNVRIRGYITKAFRLFNHPVIYTSADNVMSIGYVTDVKFDEAKPMTPSAHHVVIHVNTEQQKVTLPVSQMSMLESFEGSDWKSNYTRLADISTVKRIVTGNLIGGFSTIAKLGAAGRVVSYSTAEGEILTGIMMPKAFNPSAAIRNVNDGKGLLEALRGGNDVTSAGGAEFGFKRGVLELRVPASKKAGGKYWQDSRLLDLIDGREMRQLGSQMAGTVKEANVPALVEFFNKSLSDQIAYFETPKDDPKPTVEAKPKGRGALGSPAERLDEDNPSAQQWEPIPDEQADPADLDRILAISRKLNEERREDGDAPIGIRLVRPRKVSADGGAEAGTRFGRGVRGLSQAFGKRIIFADFGGAPIGALTSPTTANTIIVNAAADLPLQMLVGHELTHNMAAQRPDLYAQLETVITEMVPSASRSYGMQKRGEQYDTPAKIWAEWVGDVVGERMTDREFWTEFARVSGQTGGKGHQVGLMRQLAEFMQTWLERMRGRIAKTFAKTHAYVKDMDSLRDAVAGIMAEYASKAETYPENPSGAAVANDQLSTLGTPPVRGSASQEAVLEKVTGTLEDKRSIVQRVKDYVDDVRDYIEREFQQKLVDRFTAIKRLEKLALGTNDLDASIGAYKWSRLTSNLPSVMEYLLQHGRLAYRNGAMVQAGGKGLAQILKPIVDSGKLRLWEGYVAAFRAKRLLAEGKEKNFGKYQDPVTGDWLWDQARAQAEIDDLLALATAHPEFETVRQEYVDFQKSVLDAAQAAGLIDPVKRALWEKSDYVPFYRIIETLDGKEVKASQKRRGFSGQRSGVRQLKGGPQQVAILENMVRNLESLIDASFKNVAMQRIADLADQNTDLMVKIPYKAVPFKASYQETVDALEKSGVDTSMLTRPEIEELVTFWRMRAPEGKDIVSVMRGGKPAYYRVKDKPLLRSILALGPDQHSWWMKMLMIPKRTLTSLVTLDPAFMAANTIRDTFSAWAIAEVPIRPGLDSAIGFVKSLTNNSSKLGIMAAGGGSGHYNNLTPGEVRGTIDRMTKEQRSKFLDSIIDSPKKLLRLYRNIGRSTENANRIAIYDSAKKQGASDAEAAFQALDIMDFGLRGDSKALAFFLDTVPFLNARIQGLYRLGRGLKNDPKRVATHGAIIMGATLALLAKNWDDDRYNDLPEWDRDLYYHFWFGDQHVRIPKPFEVGQVFSTIPERFMEFAGKTGDSKLFGKRLLSMLADTFAMNPMPQVIKPVAERAMNRSALTGNPIISRGDEFKEPEEQYNAFTSATARELAEAMPDAAPDWMRSPKTLDYVLRGYFGTLGIYALDAADALIKPAAGYPDDPASKLGDYWIARRFVPENDTRETKYVGQFYELHNATEALATKIRKLREDGEAAAAAELAVANADRLAFRPATQAAYSTLGDIRRLERALYDEEAGLTPEERRRRLAELAQRRNSMAKRTVEAAPRRPVPFFNPFTAR